MTTGSAAPLHAFGDDALGTHDAVGLVEALRAGRVSIPEVVEAAIARAEQVDPDLNAIAHRGYERARAEAGRPRPGYFAGVPTWLKDNAQVAGMPTMEGTDAWTPTPAARDGDWARLYLATGLIPLGKTRLSEFGFSPSAEHPRLGAVRCPWNPHHTAGASSAGAAAMVAAGAAPIAHANDGGGSIRIPASVNGLVGLKPTRGRLPGERMRRMLPVRIISDGVLTRSVRDTAAFLRESERIYRALRLPPIGDLTRPGQRRLRIGVTTEGIERKASPEVAELTLKVATLLDELGHHVEPVRMPAEPAFAEDFLLYWSAMAYALVRGGRRFYGPSWDPSRLDNLTLGLADQARRALHRIPGAIRGLHRARRATEAFYADYDVALTPTLASATPRIGWLDPTQPIEVVMERILDWVVFTPLQNATGEPAVSLPLATTATGLPQGMMFAAAYGHEATLIEVAYELEAAVPFGSISI